MSDDLRELDNFAGCWLNEDMVATYGDEYGALDDFLDGNREAPDVLLALATDVDHALALASDGDELRRLLRDRGIRMEVGANSIVAFLERVRRRCREMAATLGSSRSGRQADPS